MALGYNEQFKVGERLILQLNSKEIYEGVFSDGGKDRISLTDVLQHNNNNKLGSIYEFYRSEIAKVHTLSLKPTIKNQIDAKSTSNNDKSIKIVEEEYYRLKQMSKDYVYIENPDIRYFKAIEHLNSSETIGVVALGMEFDRSGCTIRLLVLSTWQKVYIFDLINCKSKKIYPEIKEIFESDFVCKVIHKSAGLVDVLYRWYGVYVQNVFDTQIVDLVIRKSGKNVCPNTSRSVSECLEHYLSFPASILEEATQFEMDNKKWMERPLSDKMKLYASQLTTYLVLLKEHMQRTLLKDVYSAISNVQDLIYSKSDYDFSMFMKGNTVDADVDRLIPVLSASNISKTTNKECE